MPNSTSKTFPKLRYQRLRGFRLDSYLCELEADVYPHVCLPQMLPHSDRSKLGL